MLLWPKGFWRTALSVTFVAGLLVACNDNALSPSDGVPAPHSSARKGGNHQEANLEKVAKALARSMSDPALRTFIKAEANKKFDGDYDILYANVLNKQVGTQTFAQAISAGEGSDGLVADLVVNIPLLNVSVPVNIGKWDAASYVPLVAVMNNDETAQIKAFDKEGTVHWLDPKKTPDFPVVVVGISERMELSANGTIVKKQGLFMPNSGGGAITSGNEQDLPVDDNPGGGGGGGGGGPTDCNDMTKMKLTLTDWFSGNLSAIEAWDRGTPEIRMRAFAVTQSLQKVDVYGDPTRGNLWEPRHRYYLDGTWWYDPDDFLFDWNRGLYGDEVTFILHEEDGGAPKDITIPVAYKSGGFSASTNVTFRVDDGDDYVGYFPRKLPFCSGDEIGNYTLKFKVRRH